MIITRMLPLFSALVGLFVGAVLDAIIAHLAVPFPDQTDQDAASEPVLASESGALVVSNDGGRWSRGHWPRRLVVMAATAGLFAIASMRYDDATELAIISAYISVLLVCAGTDLLSFRVPNVVTYPAIAGAIVVGAIMPHASVWEVLAGGALAGGVLLAPALLTGGIGMGMGDVKLAAFVGLAIGFAFTAPAMLIMALGGGATAAFLLVTGLRTKGEPIPYAPFISAGGLVVLLWQGSAFASLT